MRRYLLLACSVLLSVTATSFARPIQDATAIVVDTRTGPLYHAVLYAPLPFVPAGVPHHGYGVYAIDMDSDGLPADARVVRSSGSPALDQAAVAALGEWRLRPRAVYKLTIPIRFDSTATVLRPHGTLRLIR
jgi:TonB family protein